MNKVILMGRLTRDPEVRYTQGENATAVARYTLAVDRRMSRNNQNGDQTADFIQCVAFGRSGEFAEKYFHKGTKIVVTGRIQTGSYTSKDGQRVYTTDVVVEDQEFAESKADFIHKLSIALKEANETKYWLLLLHESEYFNDSSYESVNEDCLNLIRLLVSIIKRMKCVA